MKKSVVKKEFKILKKEVVSVEKQLGLIERKILNYAFHFPYRKLLILIIITIFAYLIFRNPNVQGFVSSLGQLRYLGVFIAGMLFTFGFTTPFAAGFFIVLNPSNPLLVALIAGIGSVIGDMLIFSLIRVSFMDEFKRLEKTRILAGIKKQIKIHFSHRVRLYILYSLAGFIIASPLPDEAGVAMLAGLTNIRPRIMATISFVFNSLGIFILCLI